MFHDVHYIPGYVPPRLPKPLVRFCARLGFGDDIETAEEKRSRRLGKRRVTDLPGFGAHGILLSMGGWGYDGNSSGRFRGFLSHGGPLVIIHFRLGFSLTKTIHSEVPAWPRKPPFEMISADLMRDSATSLRDVSEEW